MPDEPAREAPPGEGVPDPYGEALPAPDAAGGALPEAEARAALARAQTGLLAALVAGGRPPSGFDEERLRIQEFSLIAKRRRTVARLRPDLVALLGDGFAGEFETYARGRPKLSGGSHADARDFAGALEATGRLPGRSEDPEPPPPPRWWRFARRP
ncbi:hypothetical protein [Streptosporangium lutulentum]|uniref:SCO6045-like C-terminal domain-containing protein n=1 Tax=Streptosporangium lutulentum TaxID=1461250 RepID=A0ABT9QQC1_9ACTN|nr:hypothetical protein [Streptosporangium lutulentum]MDP9848970.1 hypothetical protein [Streptosporangium lutulentum]